MQFGLGRRIKLVQQHGAPRGLTRGDFAISYLARLLCSFGRPEDALTAYLQRPLPGFAFRQGVERLANGRFARRHCPKGTSEAEIAQRAEKMLSWLDGKESDERDPYQVLGLNPSATEKQIAHRYRTLSKRVHPDRHGPERQDYWCARQDEINQAYKALSNPETRARWRTRLDVRGQLLQRLWEREQPPAR